MVQPTLTYNEVLEAARRLPPQQRQCLVEDLTSPPPRAEALKTARRLRPAHRLSPKKQKRLSLLLAKGNAGKLTASEREEVDALVSEVDAKMLAFAQAVAAALKRNARSKSRNGSAGS
jgi:hypothetical protein